MADIRTLRGLAKFTKPAQQIKDEMRAGWDKNILICDSKLKRVRNVEFVK